MSKPGSNKPSAGAELPWLAVTPGEPAGIGPDLVISLASKPQPANLVVIASATMLAERAQALGQTLRIKDFHPSAPEPCQAGELLVWDHTLHSAVTPGTLNPDNAGYVLNCLDSAIAGCQQGLFAGMVTGPVHKGVINQSGVAFSGHTEYLAEKTATTRVVMMLATEGLRVVLATTHLPLRAVADAITQDLLVQVIAITHRDLQHKFGIEQPRILVCGLNPHAGEGGYLGREEIDIIGPAIEEGKRRGFQLTGPLPADTAFTPSHVSEADAILAMYHDQGLPVLKHRGFHNAVNITLGLPIIRTSVDHGTALDLAASAAAHPGSLSTAIAQAAWMAAKSSR